MSIVQIRTPQLLQPVFNGLWCEVASTNTAQENFHYIFNVYTGTTATTIVAPYILLPRPGLARCEFSPAKTLESYLGFDFSHNVTGGTPSSNCIRQYYVYVGEQYGSLTTGVTQYNNLSVISGYTFGSVASYESFPSWQYSALTLNYTFISEKPFLTNSPSTLYINDGERASLSYLNFTSGDTGNVNTKVGKVMQVTKYQTSGGTTTAFIYLPLATGNTTNSKIMHVGTGIWNLNNVPASLFTFGVGSQPVINTATDYKYDITIWAADSPIAVDAAITETKTYSILPCTKYEPVRLMFINSFGVAEYFSFNLVSKQSNSINRQTYKKNLGNNYQVSDRGETVYNIEAKTSKKINSDWITEEESYWLAELFDSIEVYEIQSDGTALPIIITDTVFEPKKVLVEKLFNCEVNYRYAYDRNTRRN
jgi:hypothetical protein